MQIAPFTEEYYSCAVEAFLKYGEGKHKASLNFGDCLSYATAKVLNEPLLYVGGDFVSTDIKTA